MPNHHQSGIGVIDSSIGIWLLGLFATDTCLACDKSKDVMVVCAAIFCMVFKQTKFFWLQFVNLGLTIGGAFRILSCFVCD